MTQPDPAMLTYYATWAREYERIYARPERQADLRELEERIPALLAGRKVGIEINEERIDRHIIILRR